MPLAEQIWDAWYEELCAELGRAPAPRLRWGDRYACAEALVRDLAEGPALAQAKRQELHDRATRLRDAAASALEYERSVN